MVPLIGSNFNYVFPIVLTILCVFNLIDVYSKCMNCIGLDQFSFVKEYDSDRADEGFGLI